MNCKPGDIAVPIYQGGPLGCPIMEVLYLAPVGVRFNLPDGMSHHPGRAGDWVVRVLSGPIAARTTYGRRRAVFAVAADRSIRPLRDDPDTETRTTDREVTA